MKPMIPWYGGFTGEIVNRSRRSGGARTRHTDDVESAESQVGGESEGRSQGFTSRGCLRVVGKDIEVTELPIGVWTSSYKSWLMKQASPMS